MIESRLSAAPISWGVCEVPGWGQLLPADRVLPEMRSVGLDSTELGAPGFLPDTAEGVLEVLGRHGMRLVGGFVPLALHDPDQRAEALAQAETAAALFEACGADRFVTAAVMDQAWSPPVPLDDVQLSHLVEGLSAVDRICERHGLVQTLHPHVDTVVETATDVARVLAASDVRWCLDTGHLAIGGVDPVQFARDFADRVAHVHLKDVDLAVARKVADRELSLLHGVQQGLFRSLGAGDLPIDQVILELERSGYQGRYVLEQDTAIIGEAPAPGTGPVEDVQASVAFLRKAVASLVPAVPGQ
jgi:inosose dehydratase